MTDKKDTILIDGVEYKYEMIEEENFGSLHSCRYWKEVGKEGWMDLGWGNWKRRNKRPSNVNYK